MKIGCYSYNIDQKVFESNYLSQWIEKNNDIVIVSLQELDMTKEGCTQGNKKSQLGLEWKKNLLETLNQINASQNNQYDCIEMEEMGSVGIYFFCKTTLTSEISSVETRYLPFGVEGSATKGCVCISCTIQNKQFVFISSHLEAHDFNLQKRNDQYHLIKEKIQFSHGNIFNCDYLFWMGDLNYRVDLDDQKVRELIEQNDINKLLEHDQLLVNKRTNGIFEEMNEGIISFKPTFKTIIGSNGYSTQRTPSFCDRVLYYSRNSNVIVEKYCSYPSLLGSDHYPISCQFLLK